MTQLATSGDSRRSTDRDLDGDGHVGPADLGLLLGHWGQCVAFAPCPPDLDGDGAAGGTDLGILPVAWTG